jgi:hypothetical protein
MSWPNLTTGVPSQRRCSTAPEAEIKDMLKLAYPDDIAAPRV